MIENEKNIKKIGKNAVFDKKIVEIFSQKLGNYPKCVLWPRCQFGLDFRIKIQVSKSDLCWVFSEIGTPYDLGVKRDERERECWNTNVNTQFRENLSVDTTDDPMKRIYYQ